MTPIMEPVTSRYYRVVTLGRMMRTNRIRTMDDLNRFHARTKAWRLRRFMRQHPDAVVVALDTLVGNPNNGSTVKFRVDAYLGVQPEDVPYVQAIVERDNATPGRKYEWRHGVGVEHYADGNVTTAPSLS